MNTIKKYTLLVGLNDKKTLLPVCDGVEACKILFNLVLGAGFTGANCSVSHGVYTMESGAVVFEDSIRVEISDFGGLGDSAVLALCEVIKKALNQESIVFDSCNLSGRLV